MTADPIEVCHRHLAVGAPCQPRRNLPSVVAAPVHGGSASRARAVDLCADDGISDARGVADPHGVNLARWCTLCGRVLYARNGRLRSRTALARTVASPEAWSDVDGRHAALFVAFAGGRG